MCPSSPSHRSRVGNDAEYQIGRSGERESNGTVNGVTLTPKATSGGWAARGKIGKLSWDTAYGDGSVSVECSAVLGACQVTEPSAVPIGRTPTDGVNWPTNPRFDSEGRWRPRRAWPPELQ